MNRSGISNQEELRRPAGGPGEKSRKRACFTLSVPMALSFILATFCAAIPLWAADSPVTIKLWDYHIHDKKFRQNIFKQFNKDNPEIKVEYTSQISDTYPTVLDAAFRSGSPPDIFVPAGAATPSKLIEMGWVIPLEKVAPGKAELDKWMASFPQDQLPFLEGSNVFNGKAYSWPIGAQGGRYMLFWNKKLFQQAGLPEPLSTIAELRADARKITEAGQGKAYGIVHGIKSSGIWTQDVFFPAAYMGWPMIFYPEEGLDMKTGRFVYNHPGLKAYIQLWLDMKQDGSIFPGDLSMDDEQAKFKFSQDLAGMIFGGPWVPGGLLAVNPDLSFDVMLPPTDKKGQTLGALQVGPLAGMSEYYVSARTKSPEAVWRVIQFMTSQTYQEGWVKAGGGYSVFPEYNRAEYFPHPTIAKIAEMGRTGLRTLPPGPPAKVWDLVSQLMDPGRPTLEDTMQGMWIGKLGWDAWDDLEKRVNDAFDRALAEARKQGVQVTRADFTYPDWDITQNYPPPRNKK